MKLSVPLRIVLASAAFAAASGALAAEAPVAKVNGVVIPASRLEMAVKSQMAQGQSDTPELRKNIREHLINQEIASQEAVKKGLQKDPAVAARVDLNRQGILAQAFVDDYLTKNPISEDMLRKEYERVKAQQSTRDFKLRHILVEKEDDAKNIIAQLKKGASFEKLAAEHSTDPGSKGRGGDLDWGPAERFVKPFADAVLKMKKGQTTDTPVHTDFGYHVIRLDDERARKLPSFEESKNQVQQHVQLQMVQKLISDLRAKAKVE
jgi:peptidyl-prolyl cis-trans isomerase C